MTITFTALTVGSSDGGLGLALSARGYGGDQVAAHGRWSLGVSISGRSTSTAALEQPVVPAHGIAALGLTASGKSFTRGHAAGGLSVAISPRGYDGSATGGGRLRLALSSSGAAAAVKGAYGVIVDRPAVVSGYGNFWIESLRDSMLASSNLTGGQIAVLKAALAATGSNTSRASVATLSEDEIVFGQTLAVVWQLLVESGITVSSTASEDAQKIARVVAKLVLSGEVDTYLEAIAAVTAGLVFGSLAELLAHESITDQVQLGAIVAELFTAVERMLDQVAILSVAEGTHTLVVLASEGLIVSGAVSSSAELATLLQEGIGFFMNLALDDGQYVAWVLNTDSRGLSRYTNYPFNSFMKVGGAYYGVTSTGLYRLDGDDDAGTPIASKLRLGMSDLGTRKLKRIPEGFIGYTSTGTLMLQVITSDESTGEKVGVYYSLAPRAAGAIRENRWKIGKGLKSVDWDFEITNIGGADFEIDSIEWHPLILDRRTRG